MENYLKLKTFSPFSSSYVFLGCDEYLADQLFIKHKVPVKFGGEFVRDDSRYGDYQEFCENFNAIMAEAKGA